MTMYAVMAQHHGEDCEREMCRVGSRSSADQMAAKLAKEKYRGRLPGKARTTAVHRYLSVRVVPIIEAANA